jgi:hypothetical protein
LGDCLLCIDAPARWLGGADHYRLPVYGRCISLTVRTRPNMPNC